MLAIQPNSSRNYLIKIYTMNTQVPFVDLHAQYQTIKEEIDFDDLPLVEAEYIFLNLRSKSINNIVPVTVSDPYDPSIRHKVDIDLDQVTITKSNKSNFVFICIFY